MIAREYMSDQHNIVTEDGEVVSDANIDRDELPMSNEARIARMHPHFDEATIYEFSLDQTDDASLEGMSNPVEQLRLEREEFRHNLQRRGVSEERISAQLGRKFGRRIAALAQQMYDITPIVGEEPEEAEIHHLYTGSVEPHLPAQPIMSEPLRDREPDVRERQAGDY